MATTATKQAHKIGPLRAVVEMVDERRITEPYICSPAATVTRTMKGRRKCACDSCGARTEAGGSGAS